MEHEVNFILCGEPKDVEYDYGTNFNEGKHRERGYNKNNNDSNNGIKNNNDSNSGIRNNKDSISGKRNNNESNSGIRNNNDSNSGKRNNNDNRMVQNDKKEDIDKKKAREDEISEYGQATLDENEKNHKIHLLSIIGEIEGHECLSSNTKSTKYEHVLPQLATIEDDTTTDGLLILINTVGGDVSCGLALAEMISTLSVPTVSLVIGDSHSIGVPLAVATDYSFIVPTGTMIIHPVRMSGMVIGAPQTFEYFHLIQDRIVGFVSQHSNLKKERMEEMMMKTGILTKDLGTILVGQECVKEGLINEIGGIKQAMAKLHSLIEENKTNK